MNKNFLNTYFRKFGFEVHGTGFIQSIKKASFKDDAFLKQKEFAGNASVIFDVGANRGDISLKYRQLFPRARIFAFEPFPESFEILRQRSSSDPGMHLNKCALTHEAGISSLYVNKNVDTNSLLKPQKMGLSSDKEVKNISKIEIETTTLDIFCKSNNIPGIDILKLDIQGGELDCLKGASGLLKAGKVKLIYTEAYFRQQYEFQPLFHDVSKYLEQFNYYLQDLYNPVYGDGAIAWCDAIFLPELKKENLFQ